MSSKVTEIVSCDFCGKEMERSRDVEITTDHGYMGQNPSILTVGVRGHISYGPSKPDVCILCKIHALRKAVDCYQLMSIDKKEVSE